MKSDCSPLRIVIRYDKISLEAQRDVRSLVSQLINLFCRTSRRLSGIGRDALNPQHAGDNHMASDQVSGKKKTDVGRYANG